VDDPEVGAMALIEPHPIGGEPIARAGVSESPGPNRERRSARASRGLGPDAREAGDARRAVDSAVGSDRSDDEGADARLVERALDHVMEERPARADVEEGK